jgi:hypothetical protein
MLPLAFRVIKKSTYFRHTEAKRIAERFSQVDSKLSGFS